MTESKLSTMSKLPRQSHRIAGHLPQRLWGSSLHPRLRRPVRFAISAVPGNRRHEDAHRSSTTGRESRPNPRHGCRLRAWERVRLPSSSRVQHLTDWVHVTRPAAATGAGTRTGSLGKAPDTPPPSCARLPGRHEPSNVIRKPSYYSSIAYASCRRLGRSVNNSCRIGTGQYHGLSPASTTVPQAYARPDRRQYLASSRGHVYYHESQRLEEPFGAEIVVQ